MSKQYGCGEQAEEENLFKLSQRVDKITDVRKTL